MTKDEFAVARMYNALMAIGAIDEIFFESGLAALYKARSIAETCLKEMNTNHTQLIQKVLGIGK